jgi:hypothetical protein
VVVELELIRRCNVVINSSRFLNATTVLLMFGGVVVTQRKKEVGLGPGGGRVTATDNLPPPEFRPSPVQPGPTSGRHSQWDMGRPMTPKVSTGRSVAAWPA